MEQRTQKGPATHVSAADKVERLLECASSETFARDTLLNDAAQMIIRQILPSIMNAQDAALVRIEKIADQFAALAASQSKSLPQIDPPISRPIELISTSEQYDQRVSTVKPSAQTKREKRRSAGELMSDDRLGGKSAFSTDLFSLKPSQPETRTLPASPPTRRSADVTSLLAELTAVLFTSGKLSSLHIIKDGFFDVGILPSSKEQLKSLKELQKTPYAEGTPEVLVINRAKDPKVAELLRSAEDCCGHVIDMKSKTTLLALIVSNAMGGSQRLEDQFKLADLCRDNVERLRETYGNTIPLGEIRHGTSRHRALLFKYLGDQLGLPSELVKSTTQPDHYWNIVQLDTTRYVVDALHNAMGLYVEGSNQANRYCGLANQKSKNDASLKGNRGSMKSSVSASRKRWMQPQDFQSAPLTLLQQVGTGAYGAVYKCKVGGFICAVKIVHTTSMDTHGKEHLRQEINLMQKLRHVHIVSYLGQENLNDEVHIFMEYMPCSLFNLIQDIKAQNQPPFTIGHIYHVISQVALGLSYLHHLEGRTIIHGDIKSKNILCEMRASEIIEVKLCDFGASRMKGAPPEPHMGHGTPRWMAPEVVNCPPDEISYDEKRDIWSVGMVIYEMIELKLPYEEICVLDVKNHIASKQLPVLSSSMIPEAEALMKYCLVFDPRERPSAVQLLSFIITKWIQCKVTPNT